MGGAIGIDNDIDGSLVGDTKPNDKDAHVSA
jgi:hypothetical protein